MKVFGLQTGLSIAVLLAPGVAFSGLGDRGWHGTEQALAASPEQKGQARNELDQVIASLSSLDAAYASGNTAAALTKLEEARSGWNKISPAISAREAREAQLLFDSLETELKGGVPAAELNSNVYSMGGAQRRYRGRAEVGAP
jgi:hypothetical protein